MLKSLKSRKFSKILSYLMLVTLILCGGGCAGGTEGQNSTGNQRSADIQVAAEDGSAEEGILVEIVNGMGETLVSGTTNEQGIASVEFEAPSNEVIAYTLRLGEQEVLVPLGVVEDDTDSYGVVHETTTVDGKKKLKEEPRSIKEKKRPTPQSTATKEESGLSSENNENSSPEVTDTEELNAPEEESSSVATPAPTTRPTARPTTKPTTKPTTQPTSNPTPDPTTEDEEGNASQTSSPSPSPTPATGGANGSYSPSVNSSGFNRVVADEIRRLITNALENANLDPTQYNYNRDRVINVGFNQCAIRGTELLESDPVQTTRDKIPVCARILYDLLLGN